MLLGVDAKGLSASTVSRLKQLWAEEYRTWRNGALDKDRWVYIWVDGIYSGLRGEQAKLCAFRTLPEFEHHVQRLDDVITGASPMYTVRPAFSRRRLRS